MAESTRTKISSNVYVTKAGEVHKNPVPEAKTVRTVFSNGEEHDINLSDLSKEMLACAALQGLSIKVQRAFASANGSVDDAVEAYLTVRENLLAGTWNTKREGAGPRLSILAEAIAAALEEKGQTVDDARMASIVAKLSDESGDAKELAMKDLKVKAHYERIKAERAAERASKAAEAANGESDSNIADAF